MARRPKITEEDRGHLYITLFDDVPTNEQDRLYGDYTVFVRGKIPSDPDVERGKDIWDLQQDGRGRWRVLVTCISCGRISDITAHAINYNGFVNLDMRPSCVECPNEDCLDSYWPFLHGWGQVKPEIKRAVERFGKTHKVRSAD